MELPPGRVERKARGGKGGFRELLEELRSQDFNGVIRTRADSGHGNEGYVLLKKGNGALAGSAGEERLRGAAAMEALLRDASRNDSKIEVHNYDHPRSHIPVPQIVKARREELLPRDMDVRDVESRLEKEDGEHAAAR